jgi:hypothetical protein
MQCPPGLTPWRSTSSGELMPLFVPVELLGMYRAADPKLWVEPMPGPLPYNRAIRPDDLASPS